MHMEYTHNAPEYLYRIVSPAQWQASQLANHVATSPLDQDFIHLATEHQLSHIAHKFWKDKDYVVLTLDSKKLIGHLVYEANPGGTTKYYHLYAGEIPLEAVVHTNASTHQKN